MYIPSVAACSLGHSGSDRSCCACSSNIGSLHKEQITSVDVPDPSFNALPTRLSPSHYEFAQVAISLLIHDLLLYKGTNDVKKLTSSVLPAPPWVRADTQASMHDTSRLTVELNRK